MLSQSKVKNEKHYHRQLIKTQITFDQELVHLLVYIIHYAENSKIHNTYISNHFMYWPYLICPPSFMKISPQVLSNLVHRQTNKQRQTNKSGNITSFLAEVNIKGNCLLLSFNYSAFKKLP